jgi:hypothetical protein
VFCAPSEKSSFFYVCCAALVFAGTLTAEAKMARAMSNSVTNVEIEDVLSSIRRLVSEEARPRRAQSTQVDDRLVLSPALRVPDAETGDIAPPPVEAIPISSGEPEGDTADMLPVPSDSIRPSMLLLQPVGATDVDESDAQNSDKVTQQETSALDEVPEVDEMTGADLHPLRETETELDLSEVTGNLADEAEEEAAQIAALRASLSGILAPDDGDDDDAVDGAMDDAPRDITFDRKIANLEKMLHQQADGWTPAADSDLTQAGAVAAPDILDVDSHAPSDDDFEKGEADLSPLDEIEDTDLSTIEPVISEPVLETSVLEQPEVDPIADRAETEADTALPFRHHVDETTLDWEDEAPVAEADVVAPPDTVVAQAQGPAEDGGALAELDETALQALVAEIVRQELQGALGERITRNVRKLVRREIHRVLMSQDFD